MEKTNIAELLKDCPKDMELDCTMYDDVKFIGVVEVYNKAICIKTAGNYHYLTKFGTWNSEETAKCVIFPKGKTTWEGFQRPFKEGDIIYTLVNSGFEYISIFKEQTETVIKTYVDLESQFHIKSIDGVCFIDNIERLRFATEKEKQRLFNSIKKSGYKWNADEKKLEKLIVPKFKDGYIVTNKDKTCIGIYKKESTDTMAQVYCYVTYNNLSSMLYKDTCMECVDLANEEDQQRFYDSLHSKGVKWNPETKVLEPYIKFKIGDKIRHKYGNESVILSCTDDGYWTTSHNWISIHQQDEWRLLSNKFDSNLTSKDD